MDERRTETTGPELASAPPDGASPAVAPRVAFLVGAFPAVSETFVIDQVAQLQDRGVEVDILAFARGETANVSRTYFDYDMAARVRYLDWPAATRARAIQALPRAMRLLLTSPRSFLRMARLLGHGKEVLRLPYWPELLGGQDYDVMHCHSGEMGRAFALAKEAFGLRAEVLTSFYGADVSRVVRDRPLGFYDHLKRVGALYFVMSEDMRRRVLELGFPAERVVVHPVSIAVDAYPHRVRALTDGEPLQLVSVGRFVEKKGFDDLLRALALVKQQTGRSVVCSIVGGGPLEDEIHRLSESLSLGGMVDFRGFMAIENVLDLFDDAHVLVQASKTASDGDME